MTSRRLLAILLLLPSLALGQLRVHPTGQYLYEHQTGKPVFLNGLSTWCLFTALTYTQVDSVFQNCQQYGINFLETSLPEDGMTDDGPANTNGHVPFAGAWFQTTPTAAYFAHADSVIGLAKRYGIYIHLYLTYLGSNSGEGVQTEVGVASIAQMKDWGTYMGTRYRDSTNIMWGISGDIDPTSWRQKLDSMSIALLAVDTNHILTPRDEVNTRTQTHWSGRTWLKLEYIYPYWGPAEFVPTRIISFANTIYNEGRTGFMEEAWYENEKWLADYPTAIQVRQQAYYGVLAGAKGGHVFGNGPLWGFGQATRSWFGPGDWRTWLDAQGHISTGIIGSLFRSRAFHLLVPDQTSSVLTAGASTGDDTALGARASDSTCIIVYMPSNRAVTVNTNPIRSNSQVLAKWLNPNTGAWSTIGTYARSSGQVFTPSGAGDWVLVLDAEPVNRTRTLSR